MGRLFLTLRPLNSMDSDLQRRLSYWRLFLICVFLWSAMSHFYMLSMGRELTPLFKTMTSVKTGRTPYLHAIFSGICIISIFLYIVNVHPITYETISSPKNENKNDLITIVELDTMKLSVQYECVSMCEPGHGLAMRSGHPPPLAQNCWDRLQPHTTL